MLTLAFDTTTGRCAAALLDGDDQLALIGEPLERGHAERLFPLIEECLSQAGRSFADIELIATCTGPGNFTGARIGVAAARGLALSTGATAIGIDRFEALAEGREGVICIALEARGGAVHLARYENGVATMAPETLQAEEGSAFARGALLIGDGAASLHAATGEGKIGDEAGDPPLAAIARIAIRKAGEGAPRPAPRYLRPANAAPSRDAPPVILP